MSYSSRKTSRKRKNNEEIKCVDDLNRNVKEMTISDNTTNRLADWNLPRSIFQAYALQGIQDMFEWQVSCLRIPGVLQGHNFIYSAPTSAGKTLVAEILAIKTVIEKEKKAIIILPFKAVVYEKAKYLKKLLQGQGLKVGAFMGKHSPPGGLASVNVAVCVIEKANSMINRLILEGTLNQIGIIIIDELHQLGDSSRGYLLELLITKLLYLSQKKNAEKIQLVGMSATLPNLKIVANWMDALLYTTEFRPVPLQQYAIYKSCIYSTEFKLLGKVKPDIHMENDDKYIAWMCLKTVLSGHSTLVFCTTKAQVEAVALKIALSFFNIGNKSNLKEGSIPFRLRNELKQQPIEELMEHLKQCPVGLLGVIRKVVSFGVGIHHAGLSDDEREIIESGFRSGTLRVMVATSTLCSGVNLPARVVLICYSRYLTQMMYQQMAGRAGRMGIDTAGESYLVLDLKDKTEDAMEIMKETLQCPIQSNLWTEEGLSSALLQSVLELIACEVGNTEVDIKNFLWCSLHVSLLKNNGEDFSEIDSKIVDCVEYLTSNEFIRQQDGGNSLLVATRLGKACLAAAMRPDDAMELYLELERAQKKFVLSNELHLIYLTVPQLGVVAINDVDWYQWMTQFAQLPPLHRYVADAVGVEESFIHKAYRDLERQRGVTQQKLLIVAKHVRFRKALALLDLVNEVALDAVANALGVSRGVMQTLQHAASMQAGRVTAFCRELGWHSMEVLMSDFQDRLQFGIQHELCELMKISLLNAQRARILFDAGFTNLSTLAQATVDEVEKAISNIGPFERRKQEGESEYDAVVRRKMKILFITGQQGFTESQAAVSIIEEARHIIQEELGVSTVNWDGAKRYKVDTNKRINSQRNEKSIIDCNKSVSKRTSLSLCSVNDQNEDPNKGLVSLSGDIPLSEKISMRDDVSPITTKGSSRSRSILLNERNNMQDVFTPITTKGSSRSHSKSKRTKSLRTHSCKRKSRVNFDDLLTSKTESSANLQILAVPCTSSSPDPFEEISSVVPSSTNMVDITPKSSKLSEQAVSSDSSAIIEDSPKRQNSTYQFDNDLALAMENFEQNLVTVLPISSPAPASNNIKSQKSETSKLSTKICSPYEESFELRDSLDDVAFLSLLEESPSTIKQRLTDADIVLTTSIDNIRSPKLQRKAGSVKPVDTPNASNTFQIVLVNKKEMFTLFSKELMSQKQISVSIAYQTTTKECIGETIIAGATKANEHVNSCNRKVLGVSFCWDGIISYYMDLGENSDFNLTVSSKMKLLEQVLNKRNVCLFICNSKDKLLLLRQQPSISLKNIQLGGDPLIASWLLNPDNKEESLISLVTAKCTEFSGLMANTFKTRNYRASLSSKMEPHMQAGIEAFLTFHLCKVLHAKLQNEGLTTAYTDVELPLVRVLVESEVAGFQMNLANTKRMMQSVVEMRSSLEKSAHKLVNWKFNLSSYKHVAIALFDKLGLQLETQHGKASKLRSTNKDVLAKLAACGSPMPSIVLEYRKVDYIITQILNPLLQHAEKVSYTSNSRIHPCYITHTSTGRIYMREPNLQSIPNEFSIQGQHVRPREAFEAAFGNTLLSADYRQIELRLLAHFSKDPLLTKILCSPRDIFREIAAKLKDVSYNRVTDLQRQHAKKVCYGILYGMSAERLMTEIDCESVSEARHFILEFKSKFPLANSFLTRTAEKCASDGFVKTLKGRNRYFKVCRSPSAHSERQAKNTILQGSAADLVKVAMIKIQEMLEAQNLDEYTKLVMHLHDELIYETPKNKVKEVANIVRLAMESAVKLEVTLSVKLRSGVTWDQLDDFAV